AVARASVPSTPSERLNSAVIPESGHQPIRATHGRRDAGVPCSGRRDAVRAASCRSLRRAAHITAAARARFSVEAAVRHLSRNLFCGHSPLLYGPYWTVGWLHIGRQV